MPVLYLVRHGETDFNVEQRLQGRTETNLNANGRRQAGESAAVLRDLIEREQRRPGDYPYVCSPLQRARETMEILRAALGLDPKTYDVDARLAEIAYGEWERHTLPEIQARDPDVLKRRERDKWDFKAPGGESYREVAKRVGEWYATVSRDTVVVAHGGVARVLMANFHILSEDAAAHANILHGGVYVFSGGAVTRYS